MQSEVKMSVIFPRFNFKGHMLKASPLGSITVTNSSSWSNESLFLRFLEHFRDHVKRFIEDILILLLDNLDSHVNISVIELFKEFEIILVTFHSHTSHTLQHLDRTVFRPMEIFYNTVCSE